VPAIPLRLLQRFRAPPRASDSRVLAGAAGHDARDEQPAGDDHGGHDGAHHGRHHAARNHGGHHGRHHACRLDHHAHDDSGGSRGGTTTPPTIIMIRTEAVTGIPLRSIHSKFDPAIASPCGVYWVAVPRALHPLRPNKVCAMLCAGGRPRGHHLGRHDAGHYHGRRARRHPLHPRRAAGESKRPVIESPWSQFTSGCPRFWHPPRPNN
jgi:hypothetical protein